MRAIRRIISRGFCSTSKVDGLNPKRTHKRETVQFQPLENKYQPRPKHNKSSYNSPLPNWEAKIPPKTDSAPLTEEDKLRKEKIDELLNVSKILMKTPEASLKNKLEGLMRRDLEPILKNWRIEHDLLRVLVRVINLTDLDPTPLLLAIQTTMMDESIKISGITGVEKLTERLNDMTIVIMILGDCLRMMPHKKRRIYNNQFNNVIISINTLVLTTFKLPLTNHVSFRRVSQLISKIIFSNWLFRIPDSNIYNTCLQYLNSKTDQLHLINDPNLLSMLYTTHKILMPISTELYSFQTSALQILLQRIQAGSFNWHKLPYLYLCISKCNEQSLAQTFLDPSSNNAMKILRQNTLQELPNFSLLDYSSMVYAINYLRTLDPDHEIVLSVLKILNQDKSKIEKLINVTMYAFMLGLRGPWQDYAKLTKPQQEVLTKTLNLLKEAFSVNFHLVDGWMKLRALYEWTHVTKILSKAEFKEHYMDYFLKVNFNDYNVYDLITLGFIMKKHCAINEEHYNFWRRYLQRLNLHDITNHIEYKRIAQIYQNLMDYLRKGPMPQDGTLPDDQSPGDVPQFPDGTTGENDDGFPDTEKPTPEKEKLLHDWSLLLSESYENFVTKFNHLAPLDLTPTGTGNLDFETEDIDNVLLPGNDGDHDDMKGPRFSSRNRF